MSQRNTFRLRRTLTGSTGEEKAPQVRLSFEQFIPSYALAVTDVNEFLTKQFGAENFRIQVRWGIFVWFSQANTRSYLMIPTS